MTLRQILELDYKQIQPLLLELDKQGILEEILPELTALKGVDIVNGQKHKDNFYHTLQVVENTYKATSDIWLRLVAILHDIGKAPTKKFIKGQGWTFQNHEYVGSKMIHKIFQRFRDSDSYNYFHGKKYQYVKKLVKNHGRPKELTVNVTDSALRRLATDMEDMQHLEDLFLFCKCDITTKNSDKLKRLQDSLGNVYQEILRVKKQDKENEWKCPVTGKMIMEYFNLKPSLKVGEIKQQIESAIKSGEIKDDYDEAFEYMKNLEI
jgi:tRNA nucleotidyltransferase/poly(A) polymerase